MNELKLEHHKIYINYMDFHIKLKCLLIVAFWGFGVLGAPKPRNPKTPKPR